MHRMTHVWPLAAAAVLLAVLPAWGRCDSIVIGNITGATVSSPGGFAIEGNAYDYPGDTQFTYAATTFTPTQNMTMTGVSVAIGKGTGGITMGGFSLDLYTSNANLPGTLLDNLGSNTDVAGLYTDVTSFAVSGISLSAGTQYWLVASPTDNTTSLLWAQDASAYNQGETAYVFSNPPPAGWNLYYVNDPLFYSVSGTTNGALPTPEPAAWLLLATGLAGLAGLSRRRRFA